jgi:hypothetical protein
MDATGGQRGIDTSMGPSKGKGKAAASVRSGDEVSLDDDIPLQRRRRLLCSDGSATDGPPLSGERVLEVATTPQLNLK